MNTPVAVTDEWLQGRLAYWQEVLRIQDWRIRARWVRWYEMGNWKKQAHGELDWDLPRKHAILRVVVPDDVRPIKDWDEAEEEGDHINIDPLDTDPEVHLVHELLHVSMALMDFAVPGSIDAEDSQYEIGQEQHIVNLSKALVTLDRRQGEGYPR